MPKVEHVGQTFGRLLVVAEAPSRKTPGGTSVRYLECRCQCGATKHVSANNLRSGSILSCGCLNRELARVRFRTHGHTSGGKATREYMAWQDAKKRCNDPKNKSYPDYGGRGISMCAEWTESFEAFLASMGPCAVGLTLDRLDTEGNYRPGNCRWATKTQQANNTRANRYVDFRGVRLTVAEASRIMRISPQVVVSRLDDGWPVERAFTVPVRRRA